MERTNPYEAPQSDIEFQDVVEEFDQSSVFSPNGRFGRLSYLAWSTLLAILSWVITWSVFGTSAMIEEPGGGSFNLYFQSPVILIVTIVSLVIGIIFAIRRFHDINASGWWSALILIPLVNLIATLVMVFAPGKPQANNYGPPRRTRGWEKVLGLLLPFFFIVGILAAIVIPAYNAYLEAARQAAGAG